MRDQRRDLLQLAEEVCGPDTVGDATAATTRGRAHQAEADRRRLGAEQGDAAECSVKKALRPARKRGLRRVCATLRIDRALYVYKSKRGDHADLKQLFKGICETRVRNG